MLAELAAFNAGIAIVKEAINHGRDLYDAMQGISQLTVAKEDIKSKHEKAKNNPFASDAEINELFWALEKCKQEEAELQEIMTWAGRADLWSDYVTFTAEARKQRLEARKALQKNKQT